MEMNQTYEIQFSKNLVNTVQKQVYKDNCERTREECNLIVKAVEK